MQREKSSDGWADSVGTAVRTNVSRCYLTAALVLSASYCLALHRIYVSLPLPCSARASFNMCICHLALLAGRTNIAHASGFIHSFIYSFIHSVTCAAHASVITILVHCEGSLIIRFSQCCSSGFGFFSGVKHATERYVFLENRLSFYLSEACSS